MIITKPGLYDLTNDQYHHSNGVSRSQLMQLKKSPYHYWHEYINTEFIKPEPTDAMIFGSAVHTLLMEPEKFKNEYFVMDKIDRRTTAGKERYAAMIEENEGKVSLSFEMYNSLLAIESTVAKHKDASKLIDDGQIEKSLYWNDPDTGILCKSRPDIYHNNFVVDIKTTQDASFRPFRFSCEKYGYHIQAAMIQEAFNHVLNVDMTNFMFLVIEKEPPYAIAIYILDESAISKGITEFKGMLKLLKECQKSNYWPSYETHLLTLAA